MGKDIHFNIIKLQPYFWLAYSKKQNGGEYIFHAGCFFFKVWHHWSDPGVLVKYPLIQFSKALGLTGKQTAKE